MGHGQLTSINVGIGKWRRDRVRAELERHLQVLAKIRAATYPYDFHPLLRTRS